MILVVGATGQLGGLIARMLLDQRRAVRVLTRGPEQAAVFREAGAEVVTGDLKDPSSLRAACAGVDSVVTTANSAARGGADTAETVDRRGNADLIDAAAAGGVERFVLTSALGADPASPSPFMSAKGAAEHRLRDTAMAWTILEPDFFMDVWIPAVVGPALAGRPVTLVGEGRRRHSMVAMADVAAYAVAALDHTEAARQTLVIGGPEPLSWRDVLALTEAQLGRSVTVRSVAPGDPVPDLPPSMSEILTVLETYDSPIDMAHLSATFGVTPTPASTVVRDLVAGRTA